MPPEETQTDELLRNAAAYRERFDAAGLSASPSRKVAVLACMDSRIDLFALLGLGIGEAHVIRNAGGIVTEDAIRSLALSQHLLGTEEILLVHHTGCGLHGLDDEEFAARLEDETGERPAWRARGFEDPAEDVREAIAAIRSSPFLARVRSVRGFVYDVEDGSLAEVS